MFSGYLPRPPSTDGGLKEVKSKVTKMPFLDPESDLELNLEVDKVFNYLVRLLRNRNITQYIENHPAAYNEVLAAVHEIPQPKPLPTPTSTPREEPETDGQADQYYSNLVDPHDHSFPAAKQGFSQGIRPLSHAYAEDADDSSVEQTSDNSPRLANADLWPLFDHNSDIYNKDACQEKKSSDPTITSSSTPQRLDTTQLTSSKRKQHFEDGNASKRAHIELADATEIRNTRLNHYAIVIQKNLRAKYYHRKYLEARNAIILIQYVTRRFLARKHTQETRKIIAATTIQRVWRGRKQRRSFHATCNNVILLPAAAKGFLRRRVIMDTRVEKAAIWIQRMWRLKRHLHSWRRYKRKVVIVQSLWRGQRDRRTCEKIREADRTAELPTHWQTQLQRIKSVEVLEDCQRFCYKVRHPITAIDVRPDQDALERSGGPDKMPTKDRRLKQLKFMIEDGFEKEKSLEISRLVLQVSRRVHLAELAQRYKEEIETTKQATPTKRGQSSVKDKFTDLLFPHTIKDKGTETGKRGKRGKKGKKGKRSKKGRQVSENELREQAKKKLEYWLRLGTPLWKITERCGLGILLVLPKEITETSLCALRRGQDKAVADYIDLCYPGLKEQISNLSSLLPGIIASGLPSKWLMIETIVHHELSDYSFEELFQFSDNHDPFQPPQEHMNEQLFYAQDTIESIPSIRPDCTSQSPQSPFFNIEMENGNISHLTMKNSEFVQSSPNFYQELDQEFSNYMEDPVSFGQSAQLQPDHREIPNLQDYSCQDFDWRARPSSACEGVFQGNALQQSGLSDTEFFDLDSVINYSPKNTPSVISLSPPQSQGLDLATHLADVPRGTESDIKSPAVVDTWQNKGMTAWTAHDQGAGTVNLRDLFQASV